MPKYKVLLWTSYFLLALFTLWCIDRVVTLYYTNKTADIISDWKRKIDEQNEKQNRDSVFTATVNRLIDSSDYEGAIAFAQKMIRLYPNEDPEWYGWTAALYYSISNYDSAITYYTSAINKSPINAVKYYGGRGVSQLHLNKIDSAIRDLDYAAQYDVRYYFSLGIAKERQGKIEEAKNAYVRLLDKYPNDIETKARLDSLQK